MVAISMKRADREADVEKYLVKRVKALGGEVRKVAWIGRSHAPDRLVMLPDFYSGSVCDYAQTVWVELKAPGKKPRIGQINEHKRMRRLGQSVFVIDSREGVDKMLGLG